MSTSKTLYNTVVPITLTMAGLTNGSWRQSAAVVQATPRDIGGGLAGSIQSGTTPTVDTTFDFYLYGSIDGGANYTGGASGSDAAYTADGNEDEFLFIGSVSVDVTSDIDYKFGPWPVDGVFGGSISARWGVVLENNTGVTSNATGTNNALNFMGYNYETVT